MFSAWNVVQLLRDWGLPWPSYRNTTTTYLKTCVGLRRTLPLVKASAQNQDSGGGRIQTLVASSPTDRSENASTTSSAAIAGTRERTGGRRCHWTLKAKRGLFNTR